MINIPDNFEIEFVWVLWLLPLPFLIYFLMPPMRIKSSSLLLPNFNKAVTYSRKKAKRSALIKKRSIITWIFITLIWASLLAALSSPQLVGKPEKKVKTSRNFLVLADISFSMANKDWKLDNKKVTRWDAVKNVMKDFVAKREGDRMGLIFFGSSAYIQVPFTPDLETFSLLLEETDVGMAGQMTRIGKAIAKGVEMFANDTLESKVMLLLTDGIDDGQDILPLDAAEMAKRDSIIIYTIGVGKTGSSGSDLDETTLKQISETTGGKYYNAADVKKMEEIYAELDRLNPIEYEEEEIKPRTLLYPYPLAGAVGLGSLLILIMSINNLININSDP